MPKETVTIDITSDTPISVFDEGVTWALAAEASGSMSDFGGDLYTWVIKNDEGASLATPTATASARFVSLVSRLYVSPFGVLYTDVVRQRSISLYDETAGEYVLQTWPFDWANLPLWSEYTTGFDIQAQVGHIYTLTSYSFDPPGSYEGAETGAYLSGIAVADHATTLWLWAVAIGALSMTRRLLT